MNPGKHRIFFDLMRKRCQLINVDESLMKIGLNKNATHLDSLTEFLISSHLSQVDYCLRADRLRPGSKSFVIFLYIFQIPLLKTFKRYDR